MDIAVIGSGHVGLVTGACFAEFGVDVTCVDVDKDKIARLSKGQIPIYEPGLDHLVAKNLHAGRLRFTTDIKSAVEGLFKVKVKAVNTIVRKGNVKVFKGRRAQLSDTKKAIVTLEQGHSIDVTTGL